MTGIIDNEAKSRFEVSREGHTAELTYRVDDGRIVLIHTGVPEELEGHGLAGELVRAALDRAMRDDLTIIPLCPYARSWLQKHVDDLPDVKVDWTASA
jgi:predicted GNAT family acetyltransferase